MINIILTDLAKDKLMAEERLQRLINNKENLDENVLNIKNTLKEIVLIDQMIVQWKSYTSDVPSNNENTSDNNN